MTLEKKIMSDSGKWPSLDSGVKLVIISAMQTFLKVTYSAHGGMDFDPGFADGVSVRMERFLFAAFLLNQF